MKHPEEIGRITYKNRNKILSSIDPKLIEDYALIRRHINNFNASTISDESFEQFAADLKKEAEAKYSA